MMMEQVLLVHILRNRDAKPNPRMQDTMMRVLGSDRISETLRVVAAVAAEAREDMFIAFLYYCAKGICNDFLRSRMWALRILRSALICLLRWMFLTSI